MRCLNKNKTPFSYKTVTGKSQVVDANNLKTGQWVVTYSNIASAEGNISPAGGQAMADIFGIDTSYSRVLIVDDLSLPLDETSIVWVDKPVSGPHDYVVVRKAKSKNYVAYALKEVNLNAQ